MAVIFIKQTFYNKLRNYLYPSIKVRDDKPNNKITVNILEAFT